MLYNRVLLGGEFAARLLNLGMFLIICALLYDARAQMGFATGCVSRGRAVRQFAAGTVRNRIDVRGKLLGRATVWRSRRTLDISRNQRTRAAGVTAALGGAAVMNKLGALAFVIPTAALVVWELRRWNRAKSLVARFARECSCSFPRSPT